MFAIAFSSVTSFAKEGSGTSGGGGTHTCLNTDGSVKSSEMYDLYEGREARGYKIIDAGNLTANELLNNAMKKLWNADQDLAFQVYENLFTYSERRSAKTDKQFTIIKDATIVFVDKGCQYQQIAQWKDEYKTVFIDGDLDKIFSKSELNRAALALHEAVYAYYRTKGDVDSDRTRELVAKAFSDQEIQVGRLSNLDLAMDENSQYEAIFSMKYPVKRTGLRVLEGDGKFHRVLKEKNSIVSYMFNSRTPKLYFTLTSELANTVNLEIRKNGVSIIKETIFLPKSEKFILNAFDLSFDSRYGHYIMKLKI